jgi:hypothetical protein
MRAVSGAIAEYDFDAALAALRGVARSAAPDSGS